MFKKSMLAEKDTTMQVELEGKPEKRAMCFKLSCLDILSPAVSS
jgi:hypothetical protein